MGRLLRSLLVLAGVVAVLWLVRDRFVTVWRPGLQRPAPFRVPPPDHAAPSPELTAIRGIGPVYAERLSLAGLTTPEDLRAAGADAVAEAAKASSERAAAWIDAIDDLP